MKIAYGFIQNFGLCSKMYEVDGEVPVAAELDDHVKEFEEYVETEVIKLNIQTN